ncbi:50S ribosomal protein L23 [Candidatus Mesenet endosymbiont of Agriotes lineatus]|uniref:50S ribosomal protein L23 n=1 Tax=Candidatus Mesenet endosymbiont of Agriotes lineatus TaxID=3077948 RepID=UPI0030CB78C0
MMDYYNLIKSPLITEKASFLKEGFNKYALYVDVRANKKQLKGAIKSIFDVDVLSINVVKVPSKKKRFRGVVGSRKQKKKIYFSLANGQSLDMVGM